MQSKYFCRALAKALSRSVKCHCTSSSEFPSLPGPKLYRAGWALISSISRAHSTVILSFSTAYSRKHALVSVFAGGGGRLFDGSKVGSDTLGFASLGER